MKSVLTLVSPTKIENAIITEISECLVKSGGEILGTQWLNADSACDIVFSGLEHAQAEENCISAINHLPIDFLAQDSANRQKKMLISDMDSTMITVECIDEIADFAGVKTKVADITERAMRGELDFIAALDERVALLEGLSADTLVNVYQERVKCMPGAKELVQTMRKFGAYTLLVSGGFEFFTSRVAQELGFHENSANQLEIREGKLTGKVIPPVLDKNAKLQTLLSVAAEQNITVQEVLAVGDGANDLPMIMQAGLGIAYHAKPLVQASARAKINHCNLTALLYFQGYKETDIVNY